MIESPLIQELLAQRSHDDILQFLEGRFGVIPPKITLALRAVQEEDKLRELARFAGVCPDLAAFQARIGS